MSIITKHNKGNQQTLFVSFNSGIIAHIYSQIVSTFHDFNGILLGSCRLNKQENELNVFKYNNQSVININKNNDVTITEINIDSIVLIYDQFDCSSIPLVIEKIKNDHPDKVIIGLFSGKSFSYPTISLKEQEMHLFLREYLMKELNGIYISIPLLSAIFVHSKINDETMKQIQFASKVYLYDDVKKYFKSIQYEITSMTFDQYRDIIDPIANKTSFFTLNANIKHSGNDKSRGNEFENEILKLKKEIEETLEEIQMIKVKELKDYNKKLRKYIDHHVRLTALYKSLNNC